jgi:hypothetical protein
MEQFTHGDREGAPLPNKGTSTGVTDTYGADLSQGASNRISGIGRSTGSDPVDKCYPPGDRQPSHTSGGMKEGGA